MTHILCGAAAGFCVGNTPLIKLSPKKTWEGFVGGLIMTVLASWWLGEYMSRFKWMICPRTVSLLLPSPFFLFLAAPDLFAASKASLRGSPSL